MFVTAVTVPPLVGCVVRSHLVVSQANTGCPPSQTVSMVQAIEM